MLHRLAPGLGTLAVTLTLIGAIAAAGVADHTFKVRRINQAQVSEWYCKHAQKRCGGPSSDGIENAWNQRERGYQIALAGVAAAGAALTIVARRRRFSAARS